MLFLFIRGIKAKFLVRPLVIRIRFGSEPGSFLVKQLPKRNANRPPNQQVYGVDVLS